MAQPACRARPASRPASCSMLAVCAYLEDVPLSLEPLAERMLPRHQHLSHNIPHTYRNRAAVRQGKARRGVDDDM